MPSDDAAPSERAETTDTTSNATEVSAPSETTAPTTESTALSPPTTASPSAPSTSNTPHKPTDSKGWDGKLRVSKSDLRPQIVNPSALSDPEYSDEENVLQGGEIEADEDILNEEDYDVEDGSIDVINSRVSSIPALRLERFREVRRLCLRQNKIKKIEVPASLEASLKELDLYDNVVRNVEGLDACTRLESLDLSFNNIREIAGLAHLTALKELFLVQNKVAEIQGLDTLTQLTSLELGANRIREIKNLEALTKLENLWLGKNKIREIRGLDTLTRLRVLDIQSNRLTDLSAISHLTNLEELYLAHNLIPSLTSLPSTQMQSLTTLDISSNPISSLSGLSPLSSLEELWASNCKLGTDEQDERGWSEVSVNRGFAEIGRELGGMGKLREVYFEGNALQRDGAYRRKVKLALEGVEKIDANYVRQV